MQGDGSGEAGNWARVAKATGGPARLRSCPCGRLSSGLQPLRERRRPDALRRHRASYKRTGGGQFGHPQPACVAVAQRFSCYSAPTARTSVVRAGTRRLTVLRAGPGPGRRAPRGPPCRPRRARQPRLGATAEGDYRPAPTPQRLAEEHEHQQRDNVLTCMTGSVTRNGPYYCTTLRLSRLLSPRLSRVHVYFGLLNRCYYYY